MRQSFGHDHLQIPLFCASANASSASGASSSEKDVHSVLPSLFHLLSQAEGPHIGPNLLNIGKALGFWPRFAHIVPAQGVLPIDGPDGVLLFVVNYYLINCCVFKLVLSHIMSSPE